MKTLLKTLIMAAAAAALISCAEEKDESPESVQDRILRAYVEKYYPDAVRNASGLYILDSEEGSGRAAEDTSYVLVEYTITYLNGNYYSYTYDSVAKQIGSYSPGGYYKPRIWSLRASTPGVVELMTGMREGGSVKAIIPAILLDEESGTQITEGDGSSKIYSVKLIEVIDNIDEYQIEQLESFAAANYPEITDSTAYGFYFHKTEVNTEDTLKNGNYINFWYIGKYLDGTVFDTNIEDTAKRHRIYTSGSSYSVSTFTYYADSSEAMTENSYIRGFSKALYSLVYNEKAVTFFYSDLGYGDAGSGSIPGFVPLFFEIWVDKNAAEPEEEED